MDRQNKLRKNPKGRAFTLKRRKTAAKELLFKQECIITWIQDVLGVTKDKDLPINSWLGDGILLCRLTNAIRPGAISHFHKEPNARFQMIQNVNIFISSCEGTGLFSEAHTTGFAVCITIVFISNAE